MSTPKNTQPDVKMLEVTLIKDCPVGEKTLKTGAKIKVSERRRDWLAAREFIEKPAAK